MTNPKYINTYKYRRYYNGYYDINRNIHTLFIYLFFNNEVFFYMDIETIKII